MGNRRNALGRRRFLSSTAAGLGVLAVKPNVLLRASPANAPMSPLDFKSRIAGPILSIPTTYTSDFKLDLHATRNMIRKALAAGVKVFTLTSGNNQYDRLTYDEIKQLTQAMVEAVEGKGITIGATGSWWTGEALDYARFAEKAGVDGLQIAMSQYGDDESHFKHYKELVASTRLGIVVHGKPGLALWRKLVTLDSIVAFKEEFDPYYTLPLYKEFGERINIYAGGQKSRLLTYRPYGMNAYYSTFSSFAPEIAMRFWKTVEGKREREAGDIILAYDVPFFQRWSHSFWRATLEVFGIASRFLRPPEETFSDEQVSDARSFYQKLGLIPG